MNSYLQAKYQAKSEEPSPAKNKPKVAAIDNSLCETLCWHAMGMIYSILQCDFIRGCFTRSKTTGPMLRQEKGRSMQETKFGSVDFALLIVTSGAWMHSWGSTVPWEFLSNPFSAPNKSSRAIGLNSLDMWWPCFCLWLPLSDAGRVPYFELDSWADIMAITGWVTWAHDIISWGNTVPWECCDTIAMPLISLIELWVWVTVDEYASASTDMWMLCRREAFADLRFGSLGQNDNH